MYPFKGNLYLMSENKMWIKQKEEMILCVTRRYFNQAQKYLGSEDTCYK